MKVLEMASVFVSIIALLISVLSFIVSFWKNKSVLKINDGTKITIETSIDNYNQNLHDLLVKKLDGTLNDLDLAENLRYLREVLTSIYPTAKFRISVKILIPNDDLGELFAVNYVSFFDNRIKHIESTPIRIADNTDFSSILHDGREFFFVSDIKEYGRLAEYKNSNADFIQKWTSSIVFPIKREVHSNTQNIIGFLCIDSVQSLNNPKKNEFLMKALERIAVNLYPILETRRP